LQVSWWASDGLEESPEELRRELAGLDSEQAYAARRYMATKEYSS
jgi:hypothetical protein